MRKTLIRGNEAVIKGALLGGATHFFGCPVTPAAEIVNTAADLFNRSGRVFLQAENEIGAVNMIYGAASCGGRAMTASSGPGMSLMQEGLSYAAGAQLPAVVVDIQRAGPGLGNIRPEQSDYNMCCRGGGNGSFHNIVLAPFSVQEMADFAYRAFDIADAYRMVVIILSDAYTGQMIEPVVFPDLVRHGRRKSWAVYGDKESRHNLVTSFYMNSDDLAGHSRALQDKYGRVKRDLTDWEETGCTDCDYLLVAFGITARIAAEAVRALRAKGIKAGLLRPKTLFPFPSDRISELALSVKFIAVAELNSGMMAEDVELAVSGKAAVMRYDWMGGIVPDPAEIVDMVERDIGRFAGRTVSGDAFGGGRNQQKNTGGVHGQA